MSGGGPGGWGEPKGEMGLEAYKDAPRGTAKARCLGLAPSGDHAVLTQASYGLAQISLMGFNEQDPMVVLG